MITLFQNRTMADKSIRDMVNSRGWDEAAQIFPGVRAHLDCAFRGSKNFQAWMFTHFDAVAQADTDDLETAFRIFQHGMAFDGELISDTQQRTSASVGDIFKKDNQFFMVNGCGFSEPLDVSREAIVASAPHG